MTEPIISVSGLRGIVGESLTPEVAIRYLNAFAQQLPAGPILLGRDGRTTGPMFQELIRAALAAAGRTVLDVGVAATPTVGVLVRESKAIGGIQISASHNPPEYNGLKLFGGDGRVLPAASGERVKQLYLQGATQWAAFDETAQVDTLADTTSAHWHRIRAAVDVQRIRRRTFKVLLDANHGAGSLLGRIVLEELGCEATVLGEPPDGRFEHPPEPTAANVESVLEQVRRVGADVGFCQDPDADRLAVIDAEGRYLGEELTLALCVDHVLSSRRGPVVTNCSTSRMSQDLAEKHHVPFFRSAVGEANVTDVMLAHDAVLGGEGNGGVIDPRVGLVRDSFVGMALILDAMAAREATVAQLAGELPRYHICKTRIPLAADQLEVSLTAMENHFADASKDRMDGLRLDWPGKWLLVRASNTEPIIRAIAEAGTAEEARRLCDEVAQVVAGA